MENELSLDIVNNPSCQHQKKIGVVRIVVLCVVSFLGSIAQANETPPIDLLSKAESVVVEISEKVTDGFLDEPTWLFAAITKQAGLSGCRFKGALANRSDKRWKLGPILSFYFDCDDATNHRLQLDKMLFKLSPEQEAIGLRVTTSTATATLEGFSTELFLLTTDKTDLNNGTKSLQLVFQETVEELEVGTRPNSATVSQKFLQILPQKQGGYFDILLKSKGEKGTKFRWINDQYYESRP